MSRECCGPGETTSAQGRDEGSVGRGEGGPWWRDDTLALPVVSGVLWATGSALEWSGAGTAGMVAHSAGLVAGAWTFVPPAVRRLLAGSGRDRLGVGLLMTIAAAGAVLLGHIGEAAALAFLFSIAEALEDRAMDRAKRGLRALLSLMPEMARVSRDGREQQIPAAEVRRGEVLVVGAGERVATDGIVESGNSWLDTSAITGESIPVDVGPGDAVAAGSVNGSGTLVLDTTADGRDNSLTQIVRLVEQAHAARGTRARLTDRIARPLVPVVLVVAAAIVLFGLVVGDPATWTERALVVLVAASPCALAIAVPVTVISAIGSASRLGMVITSGAAFERLGTIRSVAFDKTGTLTRNRPQVAAVQTAPGRSSEEVLRAAAALEASSGHPLSSAIVTAAPPTARAVDVREQPGRGLTGTLDGVTVRVGSPGWIGHGPLGEAAASLARRGMSLVMVEVDGHVAGMIGVRDEPRPEAAEMIAVLRDQGIESVMLTGDHVLTATAIAAETGVGEVYAEQLPADKAGHIARWSAQAPTAMVGDGINDAPALAPARGGSARGTPPTAGAVESAEVAFTGADVRLLPAALAHARRGRRIMTGNIVLALAIICVLFPLALFGVLGLAAVVLVHEIAEVVVIANGLRAARTQATPPAEAIGGDRVDAVLRSPA